MQDDFYTTLTPGEIFQRQNDDGSEYNRQTRNMRLLEQINNKALLQTAPHPLDLIGEECFPNETIVLHDDFEEWSDYFGE